MIFTHHAKLRKLYLRQQWQYKYLIDFVNHIFTLNVFFVNKLITFFLNWRNQVLLLAILSPYTTGNNFITQHLNQIAFTNDIRQQKTAELLRNGIAFASHNNKIFRYIRHRYLLFTNDLYITALHNSCAIFIDSKQKHFKNFKDSYVYRHKRIILLDSDGFRCQ